MICFNDGVVKHYLDRTEADIKHKAEVYIWLVVRK